MKDSHSSSTSSNLKDKITDKKPSSGESSTMGTLVGYTIPKKRRTEQDEPLNSKVPRIIFFEFPVNGFIQIALMFNLSIQFN